MGIPTSQVWSRKANESNGEKAGKDLNQHNHVGKMQISISAHLWGTDMSFGFK
jgi:hypothetical protein